MFILSAPYAEQVSAREEYKIIINSMTYEDTLKLMGGINKAIYGIDPFAPKMEFQQLGEDDVLGVGDAPEEDEKESLPLPEDDEIDSMVESESKEYVNAH